MGSGVAGNRENLPTFMRNPAWGPRLEAMGLRWLADSPQHWGGSDQSWHDFSEVDVAVCLRAEDVGRRSWKPATKLINAWCAGAIPLVGPEPAYLDLVTPNEDAFVVDNEADVAAALKRLRNEPDLVQAVEAAIESRAKDFAREAVLDQWRALLRRTSEAPLTAGVLRKRRRDARRISVLTRLNKLRHQSVRRKADDR
jgi:glycosyltransferase involved in cell wall biosynthesis